MKAQLGQSLQYQLRCHKVWCPQVHIPFFHLQRTATTFVSRAEREAQAASQLPHVALHEASVEAKQAAAAKARPAPGSWGTCCFLHRPLGKTAFAHWFLGANSPHNLGEVECNAQGKQHLESYSAKAFERCECAQAPKPSAWGAQGRTLSTREVPGILATPCNARHVVALGAAGRRAASTSRGYSGDTIWVPNARRQECVGLNSGRVLLVFLLDSDH